MSIRRILIFIFTLFVFTLNSFAREEVKQSDIVLNEGFYYFKEEPYTGKSVEGMNRYFYKDGKADGRWITFYKNGNIKSIVNWSDGKFNGKYILYNNDGKKILETYYVDSQENGPYYVYYDNGILRIKGEYISGNPTGKWEYYDSKGKLTNVSEF